ncbi:alpha/beta hydrolase [Kribbella capetownensis]|uniref:Alpha/beta hydrolase n=1 Tax=Kribbella capetownensis TaxID=1572659 RepID=A0A4V6N4F3_9ACTN|nr:alpha/beta hydrolase [Kribbella capetownensis]TCC45072.1 alpha/beta hydrolase [Kribbella capetownensis]
MELTEKLEWNGRTIAWGRRGRGPAVVFCHGTPFSSRVWSAHADALSNEFTVYLWDMPGYGESSKRAGDAVDFDAQGKVLAALLRHWGLERLHVIAHDYGGAASLRATLFEQATYTSLLLVDTVAIPPAGSPFFRFVQDNPTTLDQLPGYIHEAILRAYIQNATLHGLRANQLDQLVSPWLGEVGQPAFYRQIAQFDERYLQDIEDHLGKLSIPVKVLWGADDAWLSPTIGRRLASLIPQATYTEIPSSGHLMQYDAPIPLSHHLHSWLAQVV